MHFLGLFSIGISGSNSTAVPYDTILACLRGFVLHRTYL